MSKITSASGYNLHIKMDVKCYRGLYYASYMINDSLFFIIIPIMTSYIVFLV